MRHVLFLGLLAGLACKQQAAIEDPLAVKEVVAGYQLIDYQSASGTFQCRIPQDWGASERGESYGVDVVRFYGPRVADKTAPVSIGVMRFPIGNEGNKGAAAYAESFWEFTKDRNPPPQTILEAHGKKIIMFSIEMPFRLLHAKKPEYMERWDIALVPVKDGFFRIEHKAPKDSYEKTLPVFEALVRSFKPKES